MTAWRDKPDRRQGGARRQLAADPDRLARLRRGRAAERIAGLMLTLKGYRILARRYRTPVGEIDIIARRGNTIAFVEVKHRPTPEEAEEALTPRQAGRILRAAEHWLARHERLADCELSLDVVLVAGWRRPRHIANVYQRHVVPARRR